MFIAEVLDRKDLTQRESDVLRCLCEGLPNKSIARGLAMSIKTVSHHEEAVYQKLGVKSQQVNVRVTAILTAIDAGMVRINKCLG